jgi:riboflavin kinase/FMN adenylyltransferase
VTPVSTNASFVSADLQALPGALRGGTVAIGNFDGVHRGHQAVLGAALERERPVVALTFEPHPRDWFGRGPLFRLTPPDAKARVMKALGLDGMVVARFDAGFASLPAGRFVDAVLLERLGARAVVIGHDFAFGANRTGTGQWLAAAGPSKGFEVSVVEAFGDEEGIVSSSRIRAHLADGDLEAASELLGYRYFVEAPIVHGEKRGRLMNYPTANQSLPPSNALRHGVYAVRTLIDGAWRDGVASFGRRPTFDNGRPLLETFVFDFSGDLYDRVLQVTFVRFLRPELRFDGMDALVPQMDADSAAARAALADIAPLSPLDARLNF